MATKQEDDMPKTTKLTRLARARVSENLAQKIASYAQDHECSEGAVIRLALKKFLSAASTKRPANRA